MKLNPHHPVSYVGRRVVVHVLGRNYAEAVAVGTRVSEDLWPEYAGWLAVAQAHLGNAPEARRLGARFLRNVREIWQGPPAPPDRELVRWLLLDNPIQHQHDIDHFLLGLRLAGLGI